MRKVLALLVSAMMALALAQPATAAPASAEMWARIWDNASGVSYSSGLADFQRFGPGEYEFTFTRPVTGCSYTASVEFSFNNPPPLTVYTSSGRLGPYGVHVEVRNNYSRVDGPVHVRVQCDGLFAVVNRPGGLVRGGGVTGVTKLGQGRYEVTFNRPVTAASFVATIDVDAVNATVPPTPGMIFTASGHSGPNSVYVETKEEHGGLWDLAFTLQVADSGMFVVTGYVGEYVRGSGVQSVVRQGRGSYGVYFNRDVLHCAALVTIGDPGDGLVYSPALAWVFPAMGDNGPGVFIDTFTTGREAYDRPFQLQVFC